MKIFLFFEKFYAQILRKCDSPWAPYLLALSSFTESCVFIIPPEVLLMPMSFANRRKSLFYWVITVVASVLGAIAGYYIGAGFWNLVQEPLFHYMPGFEKHFFSVGKLYEKNAVEALFLAAFTPIPFKVFTVAAGVYSDLIPISTLILVSFFGRGIRYLIIVAMIMLFGERVKRLLEEHFGMMTLFLGSGIIILYLLYKMI